MQRKISEQTALGQATSIGTMIALCVSLFGGGVMMAADSSIDKKYATDVDVTAAHAITKMQFEQIKLIAAKNRLTIETNTTAVSATIKSVDALALVVLNMQIRDLEGLLTEMTIDQADGGKHWSGHDNRILRETERYVADLETQRRFLLDRINSGRSEF